MKLLNCQDCGDILLVKSVSRRCFCGNSEGALLRDGSSVQVRGPCIVLTADAREYVAVTLRRQGTFPVSLLPEESSRLQRSHYVGKETGAPGKGI